MINVDGVLNGNYRCSLAGCDLNRRWKEPSNIFHPIIYAARKLVTNLGFRRKLIMFCDFHGTGFTTLTNRDLIILRSATPWE